jgi:hypothetical protein
LFEHDLFGKPVPTFPDHALIVSLTRVRRFAGREVEDERDASGIT